MTTDSPTFIKRKRAGEDFDKSIIQKMLVTILAELKNHDDDLNLTLLSERLRSILSIIEQSATHIHTELETDAENFGKFILFKGLLADDLHFRRKVSYYSDKVGLPPAKLSSICIHYTGQSAREMINGRVISESKRLLRTSSLSIKEISVILGFSDQYQFSKYFKKYVATAPLFFRKNFLS